MFCSIKPHLIAPTRRSLIVVLAPHQRMLFTGTFHPQGCRACSPTAQFFLSHLGRWISTTSTLQAPQTFNGRGPTYRTALTLDGLR